MWFGIYKNGHSTYLSPIITIKRPRTSNIIHGTSFSGILRPEAPPMVMEFQKEGPPPSGVGVRSLEHPAAETGNMEKPTYHTHRVVFLFRMNFDMNFKTPNSTGWDDIKTWPTKKKIWKQQVPIKCFPAAGARLTSLHGAIGGGNFRGGGAVWYDMVWL